MMPVSNKYFFPVFFTYDVVTFKVSPEREAVYLLRPPEVEPELEPIELEPLEPEPFEPEPAEPEPMGDFIGYYKLDGNLNNIFFKTTEACADATLVCLFVVTTSPIA